MRRITLLRHAKSSWNSPSQNDFDRPLNSRGERDAPVMGQRLQQRAVRPSLIISSSALRAISTAKIIAAEIGYPIEFIQTIRELYLASPAAILKVVASEAESYNDVMVVGHNPGMTELVNRISNSHIDNMPTCGVATIDADIENWAAIAEHPGKLVWFDYPKK